MEKEQTEKRYESAFRRLSEEGYSGRVIENFLDPENYGISDSRNCDGYSGWNRCPFGDSMAICLEISQDTIRRASFVSDICIGSIAAANEVTKKVKDMTVADATGISPEEIIEDLGGLPESFVHCAALATETLRLAILDFHKSGLKNNPWKKNYRLKG